mmetsp:Transcript_54812/g.157624  ORF Transcript_54812/g.157624 Transcript_54812/m.157624 type:complete len:213 (-) Transcript_54812:469-1107(-)
MTKTSVGELAQQRCGATDGQLQCCTHSGVPTMNEQVAFMIFVLAIWVQLKVPATNPPKREVRARQHLTPGIVSKQPSNPGDPPHHFCLDLFPQCRSHLRLELFGSRFSRGSHMRGLGKRLHLIFQTPQPLNHGVVMRSHNFLIRQLGLQHLDVQLGLVGPVRRQTTRRNAVAANGTFLKATLAHHTVCNNVGSEEDLATLVRARYGMTSAFA